MAPAVSVMAVMARTPTTITTPISETTPMAMATMAPERAILAAFAVSCRR
jgi:hypothetical protein